MHELLPDAADISVLQKPGKLAANAFDALDQLILFLPERRKNQLWRDLPQGKRIKAAMANA